EIDGPAVEPRGLGARAAALGRQAVRAPQHRLDAGEKFTRIERLRHIVVGAQLDPDDAISLVRQRRQQDDRRIGGRAQLAAKREAVFSWHHDIEHDKVERAVLEQLAELAGASRGAYPRAGLLRAGTDEFARSAV